MKILGNVMTLHARRNTKKEDISAIRIMVMLYDAVWYDFDLDTSTKRIMSQILQKSKTHSSCEMEDFVEKLIFASCVCYSDRAYYWVCVSSTNIGRRLRLEPDCTKGQQGDVNQSVHGNYKTLF